MLAATAPYSVTPTPFRFPALAALAGRAPIGGQREIVLGTYVAVRLADDALSGVGLSADARADRARAARHWLGMIALPAPILAALVEAAEATMRDSAAIADGLRSVLDAVDSSLDGPSRSEVRILIGALTAQPIVK